MTPQQFTDRKLDGKIAPSENFRDGWRDVSTARFDAPNATRAPKSRKLVAR